MSPSANSELSAIFKIALRLKTNYIANRNTKFAQRYTIDIWCGLTKTRRKLHLSMHNESVELYESP
jgi:hypothetical protein